MAQVQSHAVRQPVDQSRLVFHAGKIGRIKTLDIVNVMPGDGFEADYVGSFRLSPLRRGMALDTKLELFTFYIPIRYLHAEIVDMIIEGPSSTITLPPKQVDATGTNPWAANYLGTHCSGAGTVPGYYHEAYEAVYNNYFKDPHAADMPGDVLNWNDDQKQYGWAACHLKDYLTAPLVDDFPASDVVDVTDGLDIRNLALAEAILQTEQQRSMFATRYRDVIDMLGGFAPPDSDKRPELLQRTSTWSSGYDVNGSDQASLGQYSGRSQQAFRHTVPRFFCPEHGVVITVVVARIPPVHTKAISWEVGTASFIDYDNIVHDPSIVSAAGTSRVGMSVLYNGGSPSGTFTMAYQQHRRVPPPAHVDERYYAVEGFPFLTQIPADAASSIAVRPEDYDAMFQSDALGHWNIQCKTGVQLQRYLVSARSALLIGD